MTGVLTILGPIDGSDLGITLTHEHLYIGRDIAETPFYRPGEKGECSFNLENLGWIRQNPYSHRLNLKFFGPDVIRAVTNDLKTFKASGGGAIVENSTVSLIRDIPIMKKMSQDSGVHIIAGTGFYEEANHPESITRMKVEEIADFMRGELTQGATEDAGVRCGVMGELASIWPITDFEKRVIQASAVVQQELGAPVTFHPGRNPEAPFEIMRIFQESGGDPTKAVMSHLDRTILDTDQALEFAKIGCYCQYDLFGLEVSWYQLVHSISMPSDAQRLDKIYALIDEKFTDKILLSQDVHTRHRLTEFGGHGFDHIIKYVLPKMRAVGHSEETIDMITKENPRRWLSWNFDI